MKSRAASEDCMEGRIALVGALIVAGLSCGLVAQTAAPARPPLFLGESWKALPTPPDDHGAWPASQQGVSNPDLQLTLHGTSGKEIQLVAVRGSADVYPLNLW